eukprot:6192433-Pleurochrysis_carterae.AAC.2
MQGLATQYKTCSCARTELMNSMTINVRQHASRRETEYARRERGSSKGNEEYNPGVWHGDRLRSEMCCISEGDTCLSKHTAGSDLKVGNGGGVVRKWFRCSNDVDTETASAGPSY